MFEFSRIFKTLSSATKNNAPQRHKIILIMVLAFLIGGVAPTVSAQAAPNNNVVNVYKTKIILPPAPICAGRDYDVQVQVILETQEYQNNQLVGTIRTRIGGVKVSAATLGSSVAIEPFLVYQETSWSASNYGTLPAGEVRFKLHALKAGKTTLIFDIVRDDNVATPVKDIKVVNCKYKVKMGASDVANGGGVVIWTHGFLDTQITGDGGEMQGSAAFDFVSGFVGPPCSISYTDYQNPTTITGRFDDNDQLLLDFQYEPGTVTSSVSCMGVSGSASHEIDLTNTGIASATFPATGGTRMFTFTYAGSDFPPGKMIINVEPVSEEAGG